MHGLRQVEIVEVNCEENTQSPRTTKPYAAYLVPDSDIVHVSNLRFERSKVRPPVSSPPLRGKAFSDICCQLPARGVRWPISGETRWPPCFRAESVLKYNEKLRFYPPSAHIRDYALHLVEYRRRTDIPPPEIAGTGGTLAALESRYRTYTQNA
ncbi:hypothetical protein EVAR_57559_1 [Eumeta japonica]|uniref:Uncharacterized protein n=1 Tax=Eumeta variegata TaxID=151549 RepID=A0A4C2A4I9_EUMVA|nr:hypothetical protein EVAR_57559_1 [Eumeta japonica]